MTDPGADPTAAGWRPLELLERALAWTRPALAAVPGHDAAEPTPCPDWDLGQLLGHVLDGFTAFVEASTGRMVPSGPDAGRQDPGLLAGLALDLSGELLGSWSTAAGTGCRFGPVSLPAGTVLEVAALEIAVHGWDLSRVTARERRLPPELAAALLPVAYRRVGPGDRPRRFGPVLDPPRRDPSSLLLAHLGRSSEPEPR